MSTEANQDPAATTAREGFLPALAPCWDTFRVLDRRSLFPSRYAATDDLFDAPPPTATDGFLPDFDTMDGRLVNAVTATEGFLWNPVVPTIATDGFRATIAVDDRFLDSSPEDGRP